MIDISRMLLFSFLLCCSGSSFLCAQQDSCKLHGWDTYPAMIKRIISPTFPQKDFSVTTYGAVGDGKQIAPNHLRKRLNNATRTAVEEL